MDGFIFDIKHFAVHDGPGIRQTVFFKGCPLNCWWCHNPESQNPCVEKYIRTRKLDGMEFTKETSVGYSISSADLLEIIKGDQVFFSESGGGVTFSGGEPLMQHHFLKEIMLLCKESGIHMALDTTGFASDLVIREIAELTDLFLFDLKLLDSEKHVKYTGVPVTQIIRNLKWLDENHDDIVIRFPVIPGITDTDENIKAVKKFLSRLKNTRSIDLLPYHNISNGKYLRFQKDFEDMGFKVQIGG